MIGEETLWNKLLLEDTPPSLQSDFHELFLSVKHSPQHMSSFNSKLFLSALLSDESLSISVLKIVSNVWLNRHGFTKTLSTTLNQYLCTVRDFHLDSYFIAELMTLPDVSYPSIIKRVVRYAISDCASLMLLTCVFKVDIVKCKIGQTSGQNITKYLEHLTQNIHLLSESTIGMLVQNAFDIAYLVCFTGNGVILKYFTGKCEVIDKIDLNPIFNNKIFPTDGVLCELHKQSKSLCCEFESQSHLCSNFQHLIPIYNASRLFLDSMTVYATCFNKPELLIKVFSLATYVVSDQLDKALYKPDHIKYLQDLLVSITSEHTEYLKSTPFYKALNFDPNTASWDELAIQVKEGLSMSKASFQKLVHSFPLNDSRVDEFCNLLHLLKPPQIATLFVNILSTSTRSVRLQYKISATAKIFDALRVMTAKDLSSLCKSLYNEQGLSVLELQQFSEESRYTILGHCSNITKTINQLSSKGSGSCKDKLYQYLLLHFILFPSHLLENVVGQAIRNKALTLSVATFLKDFLPFTLRPLSSVSAFFFSSLRSEFDLFSTAKQVKLFDLFINSLKPTLSHETIVKLIMLPYIKSLNGKHTTLTFLQLYFQREPFYNFSLFYEVVRVWASFELNVASSEILDDSGILDVMTDKIKAYPKEADMMLKLVTQGWGWKAGLRFASIVDSAKIKLNKNVVDCDLSDHILLHSISFINGDFMDDTGNKTGSVARCILQVAKYSGTIPTMKLDGLSCTTFAHDFFMEFTKLSIKSVREWKNISCFLGIILVQEHFPEIITCANTPNSISKLGISLERVISKLNDVELDPKAYVKNDTLTFVALSVATGKSDMIRWLGLLCEDQTILSFTNQYFVLLCVLQNLLNSPSLEALLLSLTANMKTNESDKSDASKVMSLLSDSLVITISQKASIEGNSKIGA